MTTFTIDLTNTTDTTDTEDPLRTAEHVIVTHVIHATQTLEYRHNLSNLH